MSVKKETNFSTEIKKDISTILCLLLITAFIFITFSYTTPETKAYVDPTEKTVHPGDTFTINVNITHVTDLHAYNIIIYYDTIPLNAVSIELPPRHFLQPFEDPEYIRVTYMQINDNFNGTHGRVWVSVKLLTLARPQGRTCTFQRVNRQKPARSGSGILFTTTFHCTTKGTSALNLHQACLYKYGGSPISLTRMHGMIIARR